MVKRERGLGAKRQRGSRVYRVRGEERKRDRRGFRV